MIHKDMENNGPITLTNKGKIFLKQYTKLVNLIDSTGL
jgi:predicted transcriptional regulator